MIFSSGLRSLSRRPSKRRAAGSVAAEPARRARLWLRPDGTSATANGTRNSSIAENPPNPTPSQSHGRVRVLIALVGLAFVVMVCLVFYHSQWKIFRHGQPANALLAIKGTPAMDGAVVTIELPGGVPVGTAKLTKENQYSARLPLHPGEYIVNVEHRGKLEQDRLKIGEYRYLILPLPRLPATTRPK